MDARIHHSCTGKRDLNNTEMGHGGVLRMWYSGGNGDCLYIYIYRYRPQVIR